MAATGIKMKAKGIAKPAWGLAKRAARPTYWVVSCASLILWIVEFLSYHSMFNWPMGGVWLMVFACLAVSIALYYHKPKIWRVVKKGFLGDQAENPAKKTAAKSSRVKVVLALAVRWCVKVLGLGYALLYSSVSLGSFTYLNAPASVGLAAMIIIGLAGFAVAIEEAREAWGIYKYYRHTEPEPEDESVTKKKHAKKSPCDFMAGFAVCFSVFIAVSCLLFLMVGIRVLSFPLLTFLTLSISFALVGGYAFAHRRMVKIASKQGRKDIKPLPIGHIFAALSVINIYMFAEFWLVNHAIQAGYSVLNWHVVITFLACLIVTVALATAVWHADALRSLDALLNSGDADPVTADDVDVEAASPVAKLVDTLSAANAPALGS